MRRHAPDLCCGHRNSYISPDGLLYPCLNWRDAMGDLRDQTFDARMASHSETVKKQRVAASYLDDCDGCFHGKCHYCPGISHAEHGNPGRRE